MYLWGAGLVSRRSILKEVFNPSYPMFCTGRKEGVMFSGDDMELCKRIVLLGFELFYDPSLVYAHFLPASRLTKEYLEKLEEGIFLAIPVQRLYSYQIIRQRVPGPVLPFKFFGDIVLYFLLRLGFPVGKRKPIINWFKVYSQGIRKSGKYHGAFLQIKAQGARLK
jgi:hypothetical protein